MTLPALALGNLIQARQPEIFSSLPFLIDDFLGELPHKAATDIFVNHCSQARTDARYGYKAHGDGHDGVSVRDYGNGDESAHGHGEYGGCGTNSA